MPPELVENSGMIVSQQNTFWLHNDSGNAAELYEINKKGQIIRTVAIENAKNIDWEDLAADKANSKYWYIGDFGNNYNSRKDLCIYKIPNLSKTKAQKVEAEKISFQYPDQRQFPPEDAYKHFDMEAMICHNDSIFLFSKNRTKPYNGYTKLYYIPAQAGHHTAQLIDSFDTGKESFFQSITAASYHHDYQRLALLSSSNVWLFSNAKAPYFFKAPVKNIPLHAFSQKEALDFSSGDTLFISDEKSVLGAARLYYLKLPSKTPQIENVMLFSDPAYNTLTVEYQVLETCKVEIALYDTKSNKLYTLNNSKHHSKHHTQKFDFSKLKVQKGDYNLKIQTDLESYSYPVSVW